jgi:hypothetical protein
MDHMMFFTLKCCPHLSADCLLRRQLLGGLLRRARRRGDWDAIHFDLERKRFHVGGSLGRQLLKLDVLPVVHETDLLEGGDLPPWAGEAGVVLLAGGWLDLEGVPGVLGGVEWERVSARRWQWPTSRKGKSRVRDGWPKAQEG